MGLDDLIDDSTEEQSEEEIVADITSADSDTKATDSTQPATDTLPKTKECPNCEAEGKRFDDVWKCEEEWCGVDHFVTEKGHFCLPLEDDTAFLSDYSA